MHGWPDKAGAMDRRDCSIIVWHNAEQQSAKWGSPISTDNIHRTTDSGLHISTTVGSDHCDKTRNHGHKSVRTYPPEIAVESAREHTKHQSRPLQSRPARAIKSTAANTSRSNGRNADQYLATRRGQRGRSRRSGRRRFVEVTTFLSFGEMRCTIDMARIDAAISRLRPDRRSLRLPRPQPCTPHRRSRSALRRGSAHSTARAPLRFTPLRADRTPFDRDGHGMNGCSSD